MRRPASLGRSPARAHAGGRRQRGIAAVELGLLAPLLMTLAFAVAEYSCLIYTYSTLLKATHGAARYLAINDALGNSAARDQVRADALNLVLYGDLQAQSQAVVTGLTASMVQVCTVDNCAGQSDAMSKWVTVRISGFNYQPMFSSLLPKTLQIKPITVSSTMRGRP